MLTNRIFEYLLLPPGGPIILLSVGLLLIILRSRKLGGLLTFLGLASLYAASIPAVSYRLIDALQSQHPPVVLLPTDLQAIVVLGGGRLTDAPEYDGDTVKHFTLERLRYAARLHRETGLPILVAGGRVYNEERSEADLMKQVLSQDFNVPVQWLEEKSRNTYENASYSAEILKQQEVNKILLVTHAFHMPRSRWSFEQMDIRVTPAPTAFRTAGHAEHQGMSYMPQHMALETSSLALHEWLGLVWYKFKYR